jgi:hypothetical protein
MSCPAAFSPALAACTQLTQLTLERVEYHGKEAESEVAAALQQLLTSLPTLQELNFASVPTGFISSPAVQQRITSLANPVSHSWELELQQQAASFQRLHTLKLESLEKPFATIRALGSCPQLKHLTVGGVRDGGGGVALDSPPPALQSCTIYELNLPVVLQHSWIVKVGSLPYCLHCPACTA